VTTHICPRCQEEYTCEQDPRLTGQSFDDNSLRSKMREIEEKWPLELSPFEGSFFDSLLRKWDGPLSEKQRKAAVNIVRKYAKGPPQKKGNKDERQPEAPF